MPNLTYQCVCDRFQVTDHTAKQEKYSLALFDALKNAYTNEIKLLKNKGLTKMQLIVVLDPLNTYDAFMKKNSKRNCVNWGRSLYHNMKSF
ncbi:hypothetical protein T07_3100 [Trichinella nelsoni]|uniref:Uncharacterized protein n=1 Tax=Trichinella nelsoni TaxID=6336 RepID=A0A0V0S876_9BILA|nr:hypothetical protein T07_3100 [Trichinella nelsoni]